MLRYMLLSILDILQMKNKRITKQNLQEIKKEMLKKIVKDEFKEQYIENVVKDSKSMFYVYYMGDAVERLDELCGICVLRLAENTKTEQKYVISLLCIHRELRGNGYGTILLNEIMEKIRSKGSQKKIEIYVHSLEMSVNFYKSNGFIDTDKVCDYLHTLEEVDEEDIILVKKL